MKPMHTPFNSLKSLLKGLMVPLLGAGMTACGETSPEEAAAQHAPASASSFTAKVSGDLAMDLEGAEALAGEKSKRYHINMLSKDPKGAQPTVIIAFGTTDTEPPVPGTYSLTAAGVSGSVEIYSEPQRDFTVSSGELIITKAQGDVLTGTFKLTAREEPETFGDPAAEIQVEGSFVTRPAKK